MGETHFASHIRWKNCLYSLPRQCCYEQLQNSQLDTYNHGKQEQSSTRSRNRRSASNNLKKSVDNNSEWININFKQIAKVMDKLSRWFAKLDQGII